MGGNLVAIFGPVGACKSDEHIRRLDNFQLEGRVVQAFKHVLDISRHGPNLRSRRGTEFSATPVNDASEMHRLMKVETQVIGIGEGQFFSPNIVEFISDQVYNHGRIITIDFLNTDFRGELFRLGESDRTVAEIIAMAHEPVYKTSVCTYEERSVRCGKPAHYTQRLFLDNTPVPYNDPLILVGDENPRNERRYVARCIDHHFVPGKPKIIFNHLSD